MNTLITRKVTKKDLIGKIKGYPIDVVERMLECLKEQGENGGIERLQFEGKCSFSWSMTKEGYDFWCRVLWSNDWKLFFDRYPRKESQGFFSRLLKHLF